jgi:hypothetical protein
MQLQYSLVSVTSISEECIASNFRAEVFYHENGGGIFLRNVDIYLQIHTASQPRRPTSTSSPQCEPQITFSKFFIRIVIHYINMQFIVYKQMVLQCNMKMAVSLVVAAPCSLVEVYRRFRDACCLYHQGGANSPNHYMFTLKMATAMFAETLDNTQHSTRLNPNSRGYTRI